MDDAARFAVDAARGLRVRAVPPLQRALVRRDAKDMPQANRTHIKRNDELSIHIKGFQDAGSPQHDPVRPPCSGRHDPEAIDAHRSQQAGGCNRWAICMKITGIILG